MREHLPCTLITWNDIYRPCRQSAWQLCQADFPIDTIVAVARGSYIPGRLLSDMPGVHDLASFKVEHYRDPLKQHEAYVKYPLNANLNGRNGPLISDVCDNANGLRTTALHLKTISTYIPDFYVDTVSEWRWLDYSWSPPNRKGSGKPLDRICAGIAKNGLYPKGISFV